MPRAYGPRGRKAPSTGLWQSSVRKEREPSDRPGGGGSGALRGGDSGTVLILRRAPDGRARIMV
jgi:hypothetical protein